MNVLNYLGKYLWPAALPNKNCVLKLADNLFGSIIVIQWVQQIKTTKCIPLSMHIYQVDSFCFFIFLSQKKWGGL